MSDGHAYFFKEEAYVRYNIETDLVDVGPASIAQFWTHLPTEFQSDLDAVVNWGDGHAYFFKEEAYVRYNIETDLVDVGPASIAQFWTHLPSEFQSDLDAVVNWGDGHAYFFKGDRYLRYNIITDLVDVGPAPIATSWTHLPTEFQSDLDAVVNWGDGHAYFFKEEAYVRYNIETDLIDVGPASIAQFWTHLPSEFQSDIGEAVNWDLPPTPKSEIRLHAKVVVEPTPTIDELVAMMRRIYAPARIRVNLVSSEELAPAPALENIDLTKADFGDDATNPCAAKKLTAQLTSLFANRSGVGGEEIAVYFVKTIRADNSKRGGFANGACIHAPGAPAVLIASNPSAFTLAHEIGHICGLDHCDELPNPLPPKLGPGDCGCQKANRLMTGCSTKGLVGTPNLNATEIARMDASPLTIDL